MPATRSTGPPSEVSLQPIIMEAFENFKQRHSKQNQDLIHKNRLLLKTISELEQLVTDLRNQNIALSLALSKATITREHPIPRSSTTDPIRAAVAEIVARCQFIHSTLDHHQQQQQQHKVGRDDEEHESVPVETRLQKIPNPSFSQPNPQLIALREQRRCQLANETTESSRLGFINECETIEEDSPLALSTRPTSCSPSASSSSSPSSPLLETAQNTSFVSDRSHRRQSLLPTHPPLLPRIPSSVPVTAKEESSDSESDARVEADLVQPDSPPRRKKRRAQLLPTPGPDLVLEAGLCAPESFELPLLAGPSRPTRIEKMPKLEPLPLLARRRDSGLKKKKKKREEKEVEEEVEEAEEEPELPPPPTKKRARGASAGGLEPVGEEPTENGLREARRARKEVNYALPSLNKKMRRPEDYVSSVKRASLSLPRGTKVSQRSCSGGSAPRSKSPSVEVEEQGETGKVLQTVQGNVLLSSSAGSSSGGRRHSGLT
ncbi:hypothetical protein CROQUDRAFT_265600 [Cronartium quercuum f. sp. fusiforme G11]|uniref:Shugoshin C-terminal domain-containing protein n=1 Tax=Cronartium quercuum f. sp. fusiforme G11 TaxID=708437 RepID=A0A9P6N9N4_9BASI|nr:hypothetical protein CROQUDRAFT_265600 [Cronartium quercuum f. sp. fusiforme G11]